MSCSGVLGSLLLLPCVGACILTHTPCAGILRPILLGLSGLVLGGGLVSLKADPRVELYLISVELDLDDLRPAGDGFRDSC